VSANLSDENRLTAERAQIATLMTTWSSLNQDLSTDAEISASEAAGEQAMTATQNFLTDLSNVFAGLTSQDQNYQTVYSSFKTAIAASRSSVDTALSNLSAAEQTSASATATVSPYDVQLQQAAVTAAQAQVDAVDATIGQSTIKAPFTGVITVQNAKVGEIASPNAPVVEMISNGLLQIDAYVSEADIGKIKIGTTASTTLDAFGTSKILDATVIAIDPGETIQSYPSIQHR
jgi:multidrug resistance efflux pump